MATAPSAASAAKTNITPATLISHSPYPAYIDGIPPEILLCILQITAVCISDDERPTHVYPPILVASHVSRQWRSITLANKHLWTHSALYSPKFMNVLLDRSANLPISVSLEQSTLSYALFDSDSCDNADKIKLFRECQLARICELNLTLSVECRTKKTGAHNVAVLLSPLRTPILESLTLSNGCAYDHFGKAPPALHRVALRRYPVDDRLPILHATLTHLELSHCTVTDPNTDIVHRILRALPSLEWLALNHAQEHSKPSLIVESPVTLPKLRYLELSDTIKNLAYRLRLTSFPPDTHVRVSSSCPFEMSDFSALAFIAQQLDGRARAAEVPTQCSVCIASPSKGALTETVTLLYHQGKSVLQEASIAIQSSRVPLHLCLKTFLAHAAPDTVTISHMSYIKLSAWQDLGVLIPTIKHIVLLSFAATAEALFKALATPDNKTAPFPNLTSVVLNRIPIGGNSGVQSGHLARTTKSRSSLRVGLQQCKVSESVLTLLKFALQSDCDVPWAWNGNLSLSSWIDRS